MRRGFNPRSFADKTDDEMMITEILKIEDNLDTLKRAGEIIKTGGLVAFPTETVYGIGANGLSPEATEKIFKAKGRPSDNPLILHVRDIAGAEEIGEINPCARKIFEKFSPGPITVVVKKLPHVPHCVTGGLDTVAIRIPSGKIARKLIEFSACPIAAPSANLSGKPSPTAFEHVKDDLNGRVDMIIDGGGIEVGIESTVIDTTCNPPMILRPGGITLEMLREILPDVTQEKHMPETDANYRPRSPGMKYKHYAPRAKVIVFENKSKIQPEIDALKEKKVGVFCRDTSYYTADMIIKWGKTSSDAAKQLFFALREFDKAGMDYILCEAPDSDGIGIGVRNRLYKSAGYDIRH